METASKENRSDGRVNLGIRRLVVSHVENAGTVYAYKKEDADAMAAVDKMAEQCANMPRIHNTPQEGRMYGAFHSGRWFRAEVEQILSKQGKNIRVRMVDYGWKDFVQVSELCQLPKSLLEAKIKCEKYKMAAMKPRGRYEGYSAADREKGKKWLEKTIDGRVVEAECHILVKFGGGIQMECKIGDINLNQAALESGHVILLKDRVKIISEMSGSVSSLKRSNSLKLRNEDKQGKKNGQNKGYNRRDGNKQEKRQYATGNSSCTEEFNEIFLLLDQAAEARKIATESSEIKDRDTIMKLINIPETVGGAVDAMGPLIDGIEAVTAASKLLEDAKKSVENDAHKVALLESTTILYKCTSKFLSQYSLKHDQINNYEESIEKLLSDFPSTIPASWRFLTVKADIITMKNSLDITKNVKKYLDDSGVKQIQLSAASEAEVDKLVNCLVQITRRIQTKFRGEAGGEIPTNIDSLLKNVRSSLQREISEAKKIQNEKKNTEVTESDAVGSAWRALTAVKSQMELLKQKKIEYEKIHSDLEADITS